MDTLSLPESDNPSSGTADIQSSTQTLTMAIAHEDTLSVARAYAAVGLSILPIGFDKRPAFSVLPHIPDPRDPDKLKASWDPFKSRLATAEELGGWYGGRQQYGIGIINGPVSGNLATLDFERLSVYRRWQEMLSQEEEAYLSRCPGVCTPGKVTQQEPGIHLLARLTQAAPGEEYARDAAGNCLIETRGTGNYIVAPGSPARCHPKDVPYRLMKSGCSMVEPMSRFPLKCSTGSVFTRSS